MKTTVTYAAALLFLSLAACKKDTTVTPGQKVSTNKKVIDREPVIDRAPIGKAPIADTVIISDHQIVGKNISWIFPWYSTLEVQNIHSYISVGAPIRVFVQRDDSDIWMEATPLANDGSGGDYEYFIETRPEGAGMYTNGSLYVFYYGKDTTDKPDVKVQF